MNRPDNILAYDEMDLKLGIKSSLPHVKSTLALAILLWECSDHPAELIYSEQNGDETVMASQLEQWVIDYLADICEEEHITPDDLITGLNQNQLFKSQMEALMVAFELVWKLAKVNFVDTTKAASTERTGGVRFPKKLTYSVNIDIIHSVISGNESAFLRVLLAWTGFNVNADPECEKTLIYLLTALSEGAVFKFSDGTKDVIFNQNSIYRKLLETADAVDVNGDKEAKGPLRILKSLLSEGMNPYLQYSNGTVTIAAPNSEKIEDYQKRVDTLLRLNATKVIGLEDLDRDVLNDALADDCQGLEFSFDRVKLPAGGGTAFEIPSAESDESEMAKDITGVIVYNHPAYAYYHDKYTGGNNPPDCGSFDGVTGIGNPGGNCANCPYNKFGSGEGQSKLCKNKRMLYILRESELFPITLSLPTGSLKSFTNYVKSQLSRGCKLNQVVTKITLKKATNASGIAFSQAVFSFERMLIAEERSAVAGVSETVKAYAANLTPASLIDDEPLVDPETGEIIEPLK